MESLDEVPYRKSIAATKTTTSIMLTMLTMLDMLTILDMLNIEEKQQKRQKQPLSPVLPTPTLYLHSHHCRQKRTDSPAVLSCTLCTICTICTIRTQTPMYVSSRMEAQRPLSHESPGRNSFCLQTHISAHRMLQSHMLTESTLSFHHAQLIEHNQGALAPARTLNSSNAVMRTAVLQSLRPPHPFDDGRDSLPFLRRL